MIPVRTNEIDADGVTRPHWHYIEYGHGAPPSATPPNVRITSPEEGRVQRGRADRVQRHVSDYQDGVVLESAIAWQVDGVEIGRGSRVVYAGSAPGAHVATVTATDGTGLSTTQTVNYTVQTPGGPSVAITAPDDNQTYFAEGDEGNGEFKDLAFTATASDPAGAPLTYAWTDTITEFDQAQGKVVVPGRSTSPARSRRRCGCTSPGTTASLATHDLTLTVSNGTDTATAATTQKVKTGLSPPVGGRPSSGTTRRRLQLAPAPESMRHGPAPGRHGPHGLGRPSMHQGDDLITRRRGAVGGHRRGRRRARRAGRGAGEATAPPDALATTSSWS